MMGDVFYSMNRLLNINWLLPTRPEIYG